MLEEFLTYMKEQGWNIELNEGRETHLPKVIEEKIYKSPSTMVRLFHYRKKYCKQ
ncbi:MAG: hypothetical protein ACLRS2_20945 [[Clostridium] innocuum]